jgi:hypothetical protein
VLCYRQKEDSLAANSRTGGSRKTLTGGNPSRLREKQAGSRWTLTQDQENGNKIQTVTQSLVGNPVLLRAGDLTDRHTTKSKQEVECSTGGKDRIRKGLDAAPPKENDQKQPERHLSTQSKKGKQKRGSSKRTATPVETLRLEHAGNQLGHFSSQSKNQLAQERSKHTTRIRRELDLVTKTQTFQYFSLRN